MKAPAPLSRLELLAEKSLDGRRMEAGRDSRWGQRVGGGALSEKGRQVVREDAIE